LITDLNTSASVIQPITMDVFNEKQLNVFMKRDDLIHPFVSGNKWRKLKYVLHDAVQKQKTSLATFGGAFSNHLLAVACAGAMYGFKTTGFVRGEELDIKNPVLKMCHLFGMRLIFIARSDYREKEVLYSKFFNNDQSVYYIPEGGSCLEAMDGVAELIEELTGIYDHIFTATGTGGTLAGLAKGINNKNLGTEVHGIAVIKGGEYLNGEIRNWIGDLPYTLHLDFHRGGYAKTDNELVLFARNFARNTGIVIEPIYTAKMLIAAVQLAQENYFKPGSSILCIHTGGVWGGNGLLF
jgi:1-aminocyclopropane-1-carboxylate deaminase